MSEKTIMKGQCLCEQVQYKIEGPALRFFFCHCSRCRRKTGSAHAANVMVRKGKVEFTSGSDLIRHFDLPGAELFSNAFCSNCGSPVPYLSRNDKVVVVPAGSLLNYTGRKVDNNVFWDCRADWYDDGLEAPTKTEAEIKNR